MQTLFDFLGFIIVAFIWSAIIGGAISYLICTYIHTLLISQQINLEENKKTEKSYFSCCKKVIITCFVFTFALLSFFILYK